MTYDEYLVVGNSDGTIRFYDFCFKVVAWFEDLNLSTIKSISFCKKALLMRRAKRTRIKRAEALDAAILLYRIAVQWLSNLSHRFLKRLTAQKRKEQL